MIAVNAVLIHNVGVLEARPTVVAVGAVNAEDGLLQGKSEKVATTVVLNPSAGTPDKL